jgi:UDP-N-acetylmuramoyl-tripeptide--D-alanyl-D-alanine ligase
VEGLLNGGMAQENIFTVNTLDEATVILGQLARPGDTVLFENDLPDNYSEKQ